MSPDEIRQQIRAAVEHARRLAYERSMQGGYDDSDYDDEYDEYDSEYYGGARQKVREDRTKLGLPRRGKEACKGDGCTEYKRGTYEGKTADAYRAYLKQQKAQGKRLYAELKPRRSSHPAPANYAHSPVKYNPRYRKYAVYVKDHDSTEYLKLETNKRNKRGNLRGAVVSGLPASAARKVASLFNRNEREGVQHLLKGDRQAYEQCVKKIKEGGKLRIMLVELTRGVRRYHNRNANKPRLVQGSRLVDSYFTYYYLVGVQPLDNPKNYEGRVYKYKSVAHRIPLRLTRASDEAVHSHTSRLAANRAAQLARGRATAARNRANRRH